MYFPFSHLFYRSLIKMMDFLNSWDKCLWNAWNKMGHAADFLIEETRRRVIGCLSGQNKQAITWAASCGKLSILPPMVMIPVSFFEVLHQSKEIHSYVSQKMHILFSWTENKLYVFVQVYFPLSTLPLLSFKNEYRICNFGSQ